MRFIRRRWGASWGSSGSFAFIGERPVGCRIHLGSLDSLGYALGIVVWIIWYALGVVRFIQGRRVHHRSPWISSASSGFAGFIEVRPGARPVHLGSLGTVECALGVVVFIRGRWVHRGAPWWSTSSSVVTGLIGGRAGSGRVHVGCLGRSGRALGIVVFIQDRWVHYGAP